MRGEGGAWVEEGMRMIATATETATEQAGWSVVRRCSSVLEWEDLRPRSNTKKSSKNSNGAPPLAVLYSYHQLIFHPLSCARRHPLYDRTIVAIESQLVDVSTIEDALFDILDASRPPEKRRKIAASSTATPVDAALPNGDGSAANKAAAQEPPVPATAPPPGTEASQAVEEGDHPMDVSLPLISPSVVVAENPSTVREASPGPPPTHPTDPAEPEDDPKEHDDEEMLDAQTSLVETQVHLDDDLRPTKYLDDDDEDISMADATVAVADHEPLIKEPTPLSEEPAKTLDSGLAVERSRRSKSTSTTPAPDTVGTEKAKRRTSRLPPPPTTSKQTDAATESNIGPTVERRITRGRLSTSLLPRDAEEDVVSPVDDIRSSGSGPSARRAEPVAVPERERRKTRVSIGLAKEPLSVSASSGKSPASQGFTSLPNAVKASEPSGGSGGERERRITRGSLSSSSTVPRDRDGTTSASTSPVETFKSRELPATAVEPLEEARKTRRTTIGSSATTLNPAGGNAKPPARLTRSSLGGSGARS